MSLKKLKANGDGVNRNLNRRQKGGFFMRKFISRVGYKTFVFQGAFLAIPQIYVNHFQK